MRSQQVRRGELMAVFAHSEMDSRLFGLKCTEPLPVTERYAVVRQQTGTGKAHSYQLIGSRGCKAVVEADQVLSHEPFLIMRELTSKKTQEHIYQAITVSDLENLTEMLTGVS